MKKRGLLFLGGVLIIAVIVAVVCIISFTGNSKNQSNTVSIDGTWRVYQYAENKVDNEFMVFQNGSAADYRDGNNEPYLQSSYKHENGLLTFPDIEKEYTVRIISDNNIIIIEPDTREWKLIKVSNGDRDIKELNAEDLVGEYDVVLVAGEKREEEVAKFTDTTFTDTRKGELFLSCNYELDTGHLLRLPEISKEFTAYKNGNILMLIDKTDGYIWELRRK